MLKAEFLESLKQKSKMDEVDKKLADYEAKIAAYEAKISQLEAKPIIINQAKSDPIVAEPTKEDGQ